MGGGKWLADAVSSGHIQIDNPSKLRIYTIGVKVRQQNDPSTYSSQYVVTTDGRDIGNRGYDNSFPPGSYAVTYPDLFTIDYAYVHDFMFDRQYRLDPSLYAEFPVTSNAAISYTFSPPYLDHGAMATSNIEALADFYYRSNEAAGRIDTSNNACPTVLPPFFGFVPGFTLAYSGPRFHMSSDGMDILIYTEAFSKYSNIGTDYVKSSRLFPINYEIETLGTRNISVGPDTGFIQYKLLKDWYINNDGYITSDSVQTGIWELPEIPRDIQENVAFPTPRPFFVGSYRSRHVYYYPLVSRDSNNQSCISLVLNIQDNERIEETPSGPQQSLQNNYYSEGTRVLYYKNINTGNPEKLLDYNPKPPRLASLFENAYYYRSLTGTIYRNSFFGMVAPITEYVGVLYYPLVQYYRVNPQSLAYEEEVTQSTPQGVLLSDMYIFTENGYTVDPPYAETGLPVSNTINFNYQIWFNMGDPGTGFLIDQVASYHFPSRVTNNQWISSYQPSGYRSNIQTVRVLGDSTSEFQAYTLDKIISSTDISSFIFTFSSPVNYISYTRYTGESEIISNTALPLVFNTVPCIR